MCSRALVPDSLIITQRWLGYSYSAVRTGKTIRFELEALHSAATIHDVPLLLSRRHSPPQHRLRLPAPQVPRDRSPLRDDQRHGPWPYVTTARTPKLLLDSGTSSSHAILLTLIEPPMQHANSFATATALAGYGYHSARNMQSEYMLALSYVHGRTVVGTRSGEYSGV